MAVSENQGFCCNSFETEVWQDNWFEIYWVFPANQAAPDHLWPGKVPFALETRVTKKKKTKLRSGDVFSKTKIFQQKNDVIIYLYFEKHLCQSCYPIF